MTFLRMKTRGPFLKLFNFSKTESVRFTSFRVDENTKYAGSNRKNAEHHVYERLRMSQQCWSFELENLVKVIEDDAIVDVSQVSSLMQACKMDILDLFPKDQRLLTQKAWTVCSQATMTSRRTVGLYNYMLEAYNFQEVDIDQEKVMEDMRMQSVVPTSWTFINFLRCHCMKGDIGKALEELQNRAERNIPINEGVTCNIIQCHASLGEWQAAENVLAMMNERQIYWGKATIHAFILGFALSGDIGRMEKYMGKVATFEDRLVLLALQYLCRNWSDKADFLLDKLPIDDKLYNVECRRTVKVLIEMGQLDIAFALVKKTKPMKENNTDLDRVIRVLPSVIVLDELVKSLDNVGDILVKISILKKIDDKIVGRTVIRLVNLVLENAVTIEKAIELNHSLQKRFPGEFTNTQTYAKQNAKRRMQHAESKEEILETFRVFSLFGLRLDNARMWDYALLKLLPEIPENDEMYTVQNLVNKCWQVQRVLQKISDDNNKLYPISFIWSHIIQYLLNRERSFHTGIFFSAAAELCRNIGVAYGPNKWKISLANALLSTKEVAPFILIIEVSYENIGRKGDLSDFVSVTMSLVELVKIAFLNESNYKGIMYRVLQELWARHIMIPTSVADKLFEELKKHDPSLAAMVKNLKLIDEDGDVVTDFKRNKIKSKKFGRRKGILHE